MNAVAGAKNLLLNCADAKPGERLLIAYETAEYGYYGSEAFDSVLAAANDIGLETQYLDVGFSPHDPKLTPELMQHLESADIILFLARLGDQLRFSDMPQGKRIIVSFALDGVLFGSGFGRADHRAMQAINDSVKKVLAGASVVHVTCPKGTDFSGRPEMNLTPEGDTSILRFPMSVFTPCPAGSFSGKVALCGFLTGTGSKYYDDYTINFEGPVLALFSKGRLTGFEGSPSDVAAAERHYDRVSALFGIDRNFVHSWHAGIHPGCGFPWDASDDYERWGGSAFGNPRILHFHTCGAYAPGEISWNVVDPTIVIDGVTYWENGVFHASRLPGGADILVNHPSVAAIFADPDRAIGLPEYQRPRQGRQNATCSQAFETVSTG